MRLRVATPVSTVTDASVSKVLAEGPEGSFCILPRHIDFVTALVPGLLSYEAGGREVFLAIDRGLLVKHGPHVRVSTHRAIEGPDLGTLRRHVEEEFEALGDQEARALSALGRLESGFLRKLLQIEEAEHG